MATENFTTYIYPDKIDSRTPILTGQAFGRWLVIGFAGMRPQRGAYWHCVCACGNGKTLSANALRTKHTQSCGCSREFTNIRHGHSTKGKESLTMKSFHMAKNRCTNKSHNGFDNYGGRGIEFRFARIEDLLADIGERPSREYSLDRIDNDGHYEKGNVRWATRAEQMRNRRTNVTLTYQGRTQCLEDWATECHIPPNSLANRLRKGWCAECSLTRPPWQRCHLFQ